MKMSAKLTEKVCEQMGWVQEYGEGKSASRIIGVADFLGTAKPKGALAAQYLELTPSDREMEKHAVNLDISRVDAFEVVCREEKGQRGKAQIQELHFVVAVQGTARLKKIESYCAAVGIGKQANTSIAVVAYEKQAELPLADSTQVEMKDPKAEAAN